MSEHDVGQPVGAAEPIKASWIAVFPGQGSQSVGMLRALGDVDATVRDTFQEASDIVRQDLWSIVQNGPADQLDRTTTTQPAMLAAGVACWRLLEREGVPDPAFVAGHSLGEVTALVAAGVLSFANAVSLVKVRAHAMQAAVPEGLGGMAAVLGLDDDAVRALCDAERGVQVLEAVNFNAPGQVVIAGHADAVERAVGAAKAAGAKRALRLPVSVPSHCALMKDAAEVMRLRLQQVTLSPARFDVIQNVAAEPSRDPAVLATRLVEQLYSPVRWVDSIRLAVDRGAVLQVECGPGKVLTGLAKRIDSDLKTMEISSPETLDGARAALSQATFHG